MNIDYTGMSTWCNTLIIVRLRRYSSNLVIQGILLDRVCPKTCLQQKICIYTIYSRGEISKMGIISHQKQEKHVQNTIYVCIERNGNKKQKKHVTSKTTSTPIACVVLHL